jgi:hypothetical protein
MALPKRRAPDTAGRPLDPLWQDPEFMRDYPAIFSFLHDTEYDDKSIRVTGSITLFSMAGVLKASVNDKDRRLVAFVTAPCWDELLFLVEKGISNDSFDWKGTPSTQSEKKPPY